ncbi:MAG: IPTL-CTERM sorting domain-containing protein [Burkholderiales bacterium]|jgi:uncharacterized repeat protein (TIGR02543 family)|nr:IPTL-CTERM sorting domain-containing protein [Burkholderiales bacterium]
MKSRFENCSSLLMRLLALFGLAFAVASASAATITVNTATDLGGAGAAANCAPGNANTCRLRDAIAAAASVVGGDVGDGIEFNLPANSVITLQSALGVDKNLTIDGGGSPGLAISGNNAVRVFSVGFGGQTLNIAFSNITIRNGLADFGGGIYINTNSTLTLTDCTVSDNTATNNGGGILNEGTLTLNSSTVSGNTATGQGGGIANGQNTLTVSGSTVSGNRANYGGGIDNAGGFTTVLSSAVIGNTSSGHGGGISNGGFVLGNLQVNFSTVSGNTAIDNGGGIVSDWTAVLNSSTVSNNTAGGVGGGIANGENSLTLYHCTVSGNEADDGGGIDNAGGYLRLFNSTVTGNVASNIGGGILNRNAAGGAVTELTHVTLTGNSDAGGGFHAAANSDVTMANTLVQSCAGAGIGGITDGGGNLDGGAGCDFTLATSSSNATFALGALADNGGATWTMMPDAGSPAIDHGLAAACAALPPGGVGLRDQRNAPRPAPGNCTSGAVEFGAAPESFRLTVSVNGNGSVSAPWISSCTVTGNANCTYVYNIGSDVTLTATPVAGYAFAGWSGDCAGASTTTTVTMDAARNCSASFTVIPMQGSAASIPTLGHWGLALLALMLGVAGIRYRGSVIRK